MKIGPAPIVSVLAVSLLLVASLSPLAFHDFGFGPWNGGENETEEYGDFELAAGPVGNFTNTNYFVVRNATELSWVGDGKAHHYNNNGSSNIWSPNANYYLANHIEFGSQDLNGTPTAGLSISRNASTNVLTVNVTGTVPQGNVVNYLCSSTGVRPYPSVFTGTSFPFSYVTPGTWTLIMGFVTSTGEYVSTRVELNITATTVSPSTVTFNNGNFTPLPTFNGVFDGNGFEIRGMHTQSGLFSSVGESGVVMNLGVTGGSSINPWGSAGGIAGWGGTFINCYNGSTIEASSGGGASAAGISASYGPSSTFINCYNTGSVTSRAYTYSGEDHINSASGIGNGSAINCYNTGSISAITVGTGGAPMPGGISGIGSNVIANCYNTGTITPTYGAGIVYIAFGGSSVTILNSYTSVGNIKTTSPYYDVFVDGGTANPARKTTTPNQASGTKNTTVMTPALADAQSNNSIYYTGTVTLNGVAIPGWDFNNVWTINPSVNNGYPTLRSSGSAVTPSGIYNVTTTGAVTGAAPNTITHGAYNVPIKIVPLPGNTITGISSVTMGGVAMVSGTDYTYTSSTNTVLIKKPVTGAVNINVNAPAINYSVTKTFTGLTNTIPATIGHGSTLNGTITPSAGYALPSSITVTVGGTTIAAANYTYNSSTGVFSLPGTYVTGNIVITASGAAIYNVTRDLDNLTSTIPATVIHGTTLTGTISADTGHALPPSITVTVGGSTIAASNYTYNDSAGVFSLPGTYVTGHVVITATGQLNNYTVTRDLADLTSTIPATIDHGAALAGIISADTGHALPSSITVTVGGTTIAATDYTYNSSTGEFSLSGTYVTDNIVITASGIPTHTVTTNLTDLTSDIPATVIRGTTLTGTISADAGYRLPTTITVTVNGVAPAGFMYDSSTGAFSLSGTYVTGNIVITATGILNNYTVTEYLTGLTSNIPSTINHEETLSGTITTTTGYDLPLSVTVTVGGSTIAATDYTYDSSTGEFSLPGAYVTGHVVITASGDLTPYTVTNNVTNTVPESPHNAFHGAAYDLTLVPDPGYDLPAYVTVHVLGTELTILEQYTYDPSTGLVSIIAGPITGAVTISGDAIPNGDPAYWYTVTFNPDNGSPAWNVFILKTPAGPVGKPADPVKDTFVFDGWFNGADEWIFTDNVTEDLLLTAKWSHDTADWWVITFNPDNGEPMWNVFILKTPAGPVGKPADPVKDTFVFDGWFNGANEWIFTDDITSDLTLTAHWAHDPAFWYTVTFNPDNGEPVWNVFILKTPAGPVGKPADPVKDTFVFDGWFNGADEWIFTDNVTEDVVLTAKWSHDLADWWVITFDPDNGEPTWDAFVLKSPAGPVTRPLNPVLATYAFVGWFDGTNEWIFTNNVTSDLVLTAEWTHDLADWWVITFDPDNGEPTFDALVPRSPAVPVGKPADPVLATFVFNGWFDGTSEWIFTDNVTSNLVLTAKWSEDPVFWWVVTFNPDNGEPTWDVFILKSPAGPVARPSDPVRSTYIFGGWFNGTSEWRFSGNVTSNLTLTAKWTHDPAYWYTVTFNPNNGGSTWDVFVPKSPAGPVDRPADPVLDTYNFEGWFRGGSAWTFTNNVTANMVLTARWSFDTEFWWVVTFDPDNGGPTWDVFVPRSPDGPVSKPLDPVRSTFIFDGWFNGTNEWMFTDNVGSDMTLKAKWAHDPAFWYTVTFDADGGSPTPATQYILRSGVNPYILRPADPVKTAYAVSGWSDDDNRIWNFGSDRVTSDMTLTAVWVPDNSPAHWYEVTFNVDGASTATPAPQYFLKTGVDFLVSQPPDPVRDMFIFMGWSDGTKTWNFGSDKVTSNMTLTAEWFHDPAYWYTVDVIGSNVNKTSTSVPHGYNGLQITITPAPRFSLDAGISVKMGGVTLARGSDYTYTGGIVNFLVPINDSMIIETSASHDGFDITGRVTDRDGTPLSGVSVTYTYAGGGGTVRTGSNGVYTFHVPYGAYVTITAVALDGYNLYPISQVPFYLGNVFSDKSGVNFSMAGKSGAAPEIMDHGKIEWFNGLKWATLEGGLELPSGSVIYIKAVPDAGYRFTGWIGVDGTASMLMLTMDGTTKNIKAIFEAI